MPTFATPEPITATLTTAGAQVRVTATDRSDTAVLVEPINKASKSDVKVAEHTKVDFTDGELSVKTTVSGGRNASIAITIELPADSGLVLNTARPDDARPGRAGERRRRHRSRHQRGHRRLGGRQEHEGIGAQFPAGAGQP